VDARQRAGRAAVGQPAGRRSRPVPGASDEDVLRERGFAAEALADLANFDLRSAEGRAVATLFGLVMDHVEQAGHQLDGVPALVRLLESMPTELRNRVSSVVDEKLVEEVVRRTRMLNMGTQSLLLTGGIPSTSTCCWATAPAPPRRPPARPGYRSSTSTPSAASARSNFSSGSSPRRFTLDAQAPQPHAASALLH